MTGRDVDDFNVQDAINIAREDYLYRCGRRIRGDLKNRVPQHLDVLEVEVVALGDLYVELCLPVNNGREGLALLAGDLGVRRDY